MNLRELIKAPDVRTFRYRDSNVGPELMEDGDEDESIFELTVRYVTRREYREMLTEGMSFDRKAVNKNGIKALTANQDVAQRSIARKLLKGWKMTVAGMFALELEGDLTGMRNNQEVDYNAENLDVMIRHSQLAIVVNDLMNNHENWFEAPDEDGESVTEDSLGNSEGGQSSSSDGSPAEIASEDTSTPTEQPQGS